MRRSSSPSRRSPTCSAWPSRPCASTCIARWRRCARTWYRERRAPRRPDGRRACAAERVDAQMLLDLELLREGDPARHRDQSLAERMRMLELLRVLESPAAATPARESSPPGVRPPATSGQEGAK